MPSTGTSVRASRSGLPVRNLVEDQYDEGAAFPDRLTYGAGSTPGTTEQKAEWQAMKQRAETPGRDWWQRS
jgi:hypothetical protein